MNLIDLVAIIPFYLSLLLFNELQIWFGLTSGAMNLIDLVAITTFYLSLYYSLMSLKYGLG
jgi:hypothetical protein